jgi:hypothetical protein
VAALDHGCNYEQETESGICRREARSRVAERAKLSNKEGAAGILGSNKVAPRLPLNQTMLTRSLPRAAQPTQQPDPGALLRGGGVPPRAIAMGVPPNDGESLYRQNPRNGDGHPFFPCRFRSPTWSWIEGDDSALGLSALRVTNCEREFQAQWQSGSRRDISTTSPRCRLLCGC